MFRLIDLAAAASLLTRLPIPGDHGRLGARAAACVWAHPLIGAGLGAATGALLATGIAAGLPPLMAAAFALAFALIATGALHEDGLSDFIDGVGGGWTRERKLEIMKDSRIGGYGAAALGAALLARAGAWAALQDWRAIGVLAAAGAVSRAWFGLGLRLPPARAEGMAAAVGRPSASAAVMAVILAGACALACAGWAGGAMLLGAALGAGIVLWITMRSVGGQTGDALGAAQQGAEICALAAFFMVI